MTTLLSGVNSKAGAEAQQQLAALQAAVSQQGAAIKELKAGGADKAAVDEQVGAGCCCLGLLCRVGVVLCRGCFCWGW